MKACLIGGPLDGHCLEVAGRPQSIITESTHYALFRNRGWWLDLFSRDLTYVWSGLEAQDQVQRGRWGRATG
ncbi:hypothetical protein [Arenimonas sp. MALMAid1274]|uniref:hypothetical protein n=1 Tax=Arenimonas sp. MALMAid1274 TaxID=3411630 RepID=UPI003BA3314E